MNLLKKCIFITGTDTDAGKTYTTANLVRFFNTIGIKTIAIKPLASGAQDLDPSNNEDIRTLAQVQNVEPELIFQILFEAASAPNILAEAQAIPLNNEVFHQAVLTLLEKRQAKALFDLCLIEGVGGWKLPMNQTETLDQWVMEYQLPIIQVVGLKLGCMNHSLLTAESIQATGVEHLGWVANQIDPDMLNYKQNVQTLLSHLIPPMIGESLFNQGIVFKSPEIFVEKVKHYLAQGFVEQTTPVPASRLV